MNKISKFLAFFAAIFLVLGLFSCQFNLNTASNTPAATTMEIANETQFKAYLEGSVETGKLTDNIVVTSGYSVLAGKTKTLDLNGKTISMGATTSTPTVLLSVYGTLTIKDTGAKDDDENYTGTLTFNRAGRCVYVAGSGDLTINGGKFASTYDDTYALESQGTLKITDGYFTTTTGEGAEAVDHADAINISAGSAEIKGGKIYGKTGIYIAHGAGTNVSEISGVTVNVSVAAIENHGTIELISGGNFNATAYGSTAVYGLKNAENGTIDNITGGIFAAVNTGTATAVYGFFNEADGTVSAHGGTFNATGPGAANVNNGIFNNASQAPQATFTPTISGSGTGTGMPQQNP